MTESRLRARIVRLDYHDGNEGMIYAISPDLKGLVISRPTIEELESAIPKAIQDMYEACGERVMVTRVNPEDLCGADAWVAVPFEVAKRAMDQQSIP